MLQHIELTTTISTSQFGQRLDQALAESFPDYSRSRLKTWIVEGCVSLNGRVANLPKEKVLGGESVVISAIIEEAVLWQPQPIELDRVYEDDDILVINKPRDLVVHPGAGNTDGTVLNALLYHYPEIAQVPRAGIIHRLDKDTTGLMVIAKTIPAQTRLVELLQQREITREYEAIAQGIMTTGGMIDEPISRHPIKRTHMAVHPLGKPAITHYRIMEKFRIHTRLRLRLETGRTHQIRVHMAHIHHPLVGDPNYGTRIRLPKNASPELVQCIRQFNRQALHAIMLQLPHPIRGEVMCWTVPIPQDMIELIQLLQQDKMQFINEVD